MSVCIPAYGRPIELRQAVQSVLAQGYSDFELIISDDSGNLDEAIEGINDSRVRYFKNDRNYGMAGNWSLSVDRARGRFVALLMDDDEWLPGFLDRVMRRFEADPALDVVFTNHFFKAKNRLRARRCALPAGSYRPFLDTFLRYQPIAVSAAVMRRTVWDQVRPLPDLWTADFVMYLRAAMAGLAFCYVDEPLMIYRIHHGQLSSQELRFRRDGVRMWEMFSFDDSACERERRSWLARALICLAATLIKGGDYEEAKSAALRARALAPSGLSLYEQTLAFAASRGASARLSAWVWRRVQSVGPAAQVTHG